MYFKRTVISVIAAATAASASSPPKYTDCRSCVEAGLKWQEAGKACNPMCMIADASCIDERNIDLCDNIPPERPWNQPFDPSMYKNCKDCTQNQQKWFNNKCVAQCPADAPCYTKPSACPKQCDCYVDLRKDKKYKLNYINMWAGNKPCARSLGALFQGRCLYFVANDGESLGKRVTANCGAGSLKYVKLRTESGKSVGWVAEKFLACRSSNKPIPPPPAPAPAASQSQLPKAPSESDNAF